MRESERGVLARWCRMVLSGVVVLGIGLVLLRYAGDKQVSHAQSPTLSVPAGLTTTDAADHDVLKAEGLSRAFRSAAKKVLPAVVVIKASVSPVCPRCGRAHDSQEEGASSAFESDHAKSLDILGSGFIVAPSGIVLTNKHVVKGDQRLVVQTADGKQYPAKRVATDRQYDAAVLQIEAKDPLPFVRLGDSDMAEIGDWVLTIGCPLELEQTVSAGIISAKNRSFCSKHQARFLQTDAVINPGSSGGPLVALNGQVIGITTAMASEDGGYQGIGFAIPVNLVKQLVTQSSQSNLKESPSSDLDKR